MDLIATPKNPVPLGASVGVIKGKGGAKLRFATWRSALKQRYGTVCIFSGRAEFIEKYFEVVGELRRRGFAVAVLDWRGQGGSDRTFGSRLKGHVKSFADYDNDLVRFMSDVVLPDCPPPYYALGHSMGGTVLLRSATERGCWFSRMVLTAPMLKAFEAPLPPGAISALMTAASLAGLGRLAAPGAEKLMSKEFEGNPLTSDRERFLRNQSVMNTAPELVVGPPTIGWVRSAFAAMHGINSDAFPGRLRVPVLMIAAGDDRIVSSKAIEDFALRLRIGSQLLLRGARHEILQERDLIREQFWAAFDAFVPSAATRKFGETAVA